MKILVAVLGSLVLAVGALTVQLHHGQRELADRIARLESRGGQPPGTADRTAPSPDAAPVRPLDPARSAPAIRPPPAPAEPPAPVFPPGAPSSGALTPDQREAVSREVDRILREKYGDRPLLARREDPLEVMERELELSPSQKARIADILKEEEREGMKILESSSLMEGIRRMQQAEERAVAAIRRELTVAQQEKYDRLRKEGRLGGFGGVRMFRGDGAGESED